MAREILDWNTVNWRKVYRHSYRPIELRGLSSPYITIRAVGLLLILLCALVIPGTQIRWDWISILISLAVVIWLVWVLWPILANLVHRWASRFVIKARIENKLEAQFWQKDTRSIIIVIQKAFRITPQGDLIEARSWIGRCKISIPAWLFHYVDEQEEVDLLCLSTRQVLGKLEQFSKL